MRPRSLLALLGLIGLLATAPVRAETGKQRFHVVYSGQRLASIAKRYHVSVEALRSANGLKRTDRIKPGQKLLIPSPDDPDADLARPANADTPSLSAKSSARSEKLDSVPSGALPRSERVHRVEPGQRLGSIAKRYGVSVEALCTVNGLRRGETLRPGQRLIVPEADTDEASGSKATSGKELGEPARRNGYVDLYTYTARWRGQVLDRKGKLSSSAIAGISRLLGATGDRPRVDTRLIRLLVEISDAFAGRPIRVVSGYRTSSYYEDSRHKLSRAIDFSIPGVSNQRLRDYLRHFEDVGVGYYPNSSFVHLDVRETSTYWVDYAGPGQSPRARPEEPRAVASDEPETQDDGEAHADAEPRATERQTEPASVEVERAPSGRAPSGSRSGQTTGSPPLL